MNKINNQIKSVNFDFKIIETKILSLYKVNKKKGFQELLVKLLFRI